MVDNMIKVKLVYGGVLGEIVGKQYEEVYIENGVLLEELLQTILGRDARAREWLEKIPIIHVLVNGREVNPKAYRLENGDEVVLYPSLYEGG